MSLLLGVSQELLVHILSHLHYVDLNVCRRVNQALNRLIQSSVLLQYSMQLQLSGYEDNPKCPMTLIDKLRLLRQQEHAWSCLDFEKEISVHIPFNPSSIYDVTEGVVLLGESTCGVQSGADIIRWARLSSFVSNPTHPDNWQKLDVGAHVIDVGLASQELDLIVVAADREADEHQTVFELRLIQLSTGLSHPLASKPVIPLVTIPSTPRSVVAQCSVCVEIVSDLLCFLFHYPAGSTTPPAMFEVYNWKTGNCLQVREIECSSYSTFTFLTPSIIALPNCVENTIELCKLSAFTDYSGPATKLQSSCVLELPCLRKGHSIAQITCRCEPKMTTSTKGVSAFRSNEPFYLNPQDAIAIFNVMTHDVHGFHECLTLIVHAAALLTVMATHITLAPAASRPPSFAHADGINVFGYEGVQGVAPRIHWAQWGPRACRWLESSFGASRWITTTCGQRYVTVEEDMIDVNLTRSTIVVYDFNPHTVRKLAALHRKKRRRRGYWDITLPEGELVAGSEAAAVAYPRIESPVLIPYTDPKTRVIGQIQCEETELMGVYAPEYRVFEGTVMSSLPYVQSSSFETYAYGAVLLDKNVVIGVKLNDKDDIRELVIHSIRSRCVE